MTENLKGQLELAVTEICDWGGKRKEAPPCRLPWIEEMTVEDVECLQRLLRLRSDPFSWCVSTFKRIVKLREAKGLSSTEALDAVARLKRQGAPPAVLFFMAAHAWCYQHVHDLFVNREKFDDKRQITNLENEKQHHHATKRPKTLVRQHAKRLIDAATNLREAAELLGKQQDQLHEEVWFLTGTARFLRERSVVDLLAELAKVVAEDRDEDLADFGAFKLLTVSEDSGIPGMPLLHSRDWAPKKDALDPEVPRAIDGIAKVLGGIGVNASVDGAVRLLTLFGIENITQSRIRQARHTRREREEGGA